MAKKEQNVGWEDKVWHEIKMMCKCGGVGVIADIFFNIEGEITVAANCSSCQKDIMAVLSVMDRAMFCYELEAETELRKAKCPTKSVH